MIKYINLKNIKGEEKMKKILAVVLAVAMLAVLAISASAVLEHADGDTRNFTRDKTHVNHSFDTLFVDGVSQMDLKWGADGHAEKMITDNPIVVGENVNETLTLRGWVGMNQTEHDGVTVAEIGYYTNEDAATYTTAGQLNAAEQPVIDAGGEFRFEGFNIDVKGLTEPTLFTIVVKGSDGNLYPFGEFSINGNYETATQTDDDTTEATQTDDDTTGAVQTDDDTKAQDPGTQADTTAATETKGDDTPKNPKTADAAIIAVAAVAAVALAGVVIAKKASK